MFYYYQNWTYKDVYIYNVTDKNICRMVRNVMIEKVCPSDAVKIFNYYQLTALVTFRYFLDISMTFVILSEKVYFVSGMRINWGKIKRGESNGLYLEANFLPLCVK